MQICDVLITILLVIEAPPLRKVATNWGELYFDLVSFAALFFGCHATLRDILKTAAKETNFDPAHLDSFVNKSSSEPSRFQVWILLC